MFLLLWGICLWSLDKLRIQYANILSIKSGMCNKLRVCITFVDYNLFLFIAQLSFIFYSSLTLLTIYGFIMTLFSRTFGLSIESGISTFYLLMFVFLILPINRIPGRENRLSFFRLFKSILFPSGIVSFSEILLADALTSLSKVFKDFGISLYCLLAYYNKAYPIEFHDQAMILIAALASFPFL